MRVLGLDLGERRIGVAVSDSAQTVATPYDVVLRSGDRRRDHHRIGELVAEIEAGEVVVGLPLSLDGGKGPAARGVEAEVAELERALPVPVHVHDERLTTVTADRLLRDQNVRGPRRRKIIDKVAAAVMLQSWLDGRP